MYNITQIMGGKKGQNSLPASKYDDSLRINSPRGGVVCRSHIYRAEFDAPDSSAENAEYTWQEARHDRATGYYRLYLICSKMREMSISQKAESETPDDKIRTVSQQAANGEDRLYPLNEALQKMHAFEQGQNNIGAVPITPNTVPVQGQEQQSIPLHYSKYAVYNRWILDIHGMAHRLINGLPTGDGEFAQDMLALAQIAYLQSLPDIEKSFNACLQSMTDWAEIQKNVDTLTALTSLSEQTLKQMRDDVSFLHDYCSTLYDMFHEPWQANSPKKINQFLEEKYSSLKKVKGRIQDSMSFLDICEKVKKLVLLVSGIDALCAANMLKAKELGTFNKFSTNWIPIRGLISIAQGKLSDVLPEDVVEAYITQAQIAGTAFPVPQTLVDMTASLKDFFDVALEAKRKGHENAPSLPKLTSVSLPKPSPH